MREPFAITVRIRLAQAALQVPEDALKIQSPDGFSRGRISVQDQILRFAGQLIEGLLKIESVGGNGNAERALQLRRTRLRGPGRLRKEVSSNR